jgi:molecular chaperone GrpE
MNNEEKTLEEIETKAVEAEVIEATAEETQTNQTPEETTNEESVMAAVVNALQGEISKLRELLDEQTQKVEQSKKQYLTIAADFENYRKRTDKEKEEQEKRVKKQTIIELQLLPVLDNFERARTQIRPNTDGENAIHKSYQGVYKNLVDGMKKLGVLPMKPEGEMFDPQYHDAMLREPTNDHPEGTVLEQLVRGYTINEEVLRHAMVKVATPAETEVLPEIDHQTEDFKQ